MLSRRCYSLVSNSLPYAAEEAGVPLVNHHDAAEDARACAGILIDIAARNGAGSIAELYLSLGLTVSHQPAFDPRRDPLSKATLVALEALAGGTAGAAPGRRLRGRAGRRKAPNPLPNAAASPGHPLFGQTVVFTGELAIPRPEAKVRSAELGARPESRVTARTTVLVVGDGFVAADLRSGRLTGKARRVLELHERGPADRGPVRGRIPPDGRRPRRLGRTLPDACPARRAPGTPAVTRRNNHSAHGAPAPSLGAMSKPHARPARRACRRLRRPQVSPARAELTGGGCSRFRTR